MNNKMYDPVRNRVTMASRTAFPELYAETYWGSSAYKGTPEEDEICFYRTELVEKFDLERRWKQVDIPHVLRRNVLETVTEIDHVEAYLTYVGRVLLIVSNYNAPPPSVLRIPEYVGKLYHPNAKSYVRLWNNRNEFRKHMKAAAELTVLKETAEFPINYNAY